MSAGGVDMQSGGNFLLLQGEEIADAVDGQNACIICRQHDECLRRLGRYLPFERVLLFQFGGRRFSEEFLREPLWVTPFSMEMTG